MRSAISISDETMTCITGIRLSDGHLQQRSITGNSRFIFAQSGVLCLRKREKGGASEYFNLILEIMRPFCNANYVPYAKEWIDIRFNTINSSISLTTMQLPCFTSLRNI